METKTQLKNLLFLHCWLKRAVIEEDEYELSIRKSMNYGHTIGHAIRGCLLILRYHMVLGLR